MVLRFASQKLLNLYFKCSILHLIKYIQRNKESKEKKTQQNAAWLFLWEWWRRRKCVWAVLCMWRCTLSAVINVSAWDMPDGIFTSALRLLYFPQEDFHILKTSNDKIETGGRDCRISCGKTNQCWFGVCQLENILFSLAPWIIFIFESSLHCFLRNGPFIFWSQVL